MTTFKGIISLVLFFLGIAPLLAWDVFMFVISWLGIYTPLWLRYHPLDSRSKRPL